MKQLNNETILSLDTTRELTKIALYSVQGKLIDRYEWPARFSQSEELLQKVDTLLHKNQLSKKDLRGIIINRGPCSYTGVRVGITTANLLAFSLNIPILGIKDEKDDFERKVFDLITLNSFNEPVEPFYDRPPHITQSKNKL
jgi:hypothetical protein